MRVLLLKLLARVLCCANRRPPTNGVERESFYELKTSILERWGECEERGLYGPMPRFDIQHIAKSCWGCGGVGAPPHDDEGDEDDDGRCRRCGGTGVYENVYVKLERRTLGGFLFHIPRGRIAPTEQRADIEGYVRHDAVDARAANEAWLWLALVFDRGAFRWAMRGTHAFMGFTWWPLTAIQQEIHRMRAAARWCRDLPKRLWRQRSQAAWIDPSEIPF